MTDPTALPNFTPYDPAGTPNGAAQSQSPARDAVLAVLTGIGIDAQVDADGDLEYKIVDDEGTTTTLFDRIARCNDLTLQLNLVKLSLVQESLVVSVEHVILPGSDLNVLVPLSINHILQGVGFFYQSWAPIEDVPAGEQ